MKVFGNNYRYTNNITPTGWLKKSISSHLTENCEEPSYTRIPVHLLWLTEGICDTPCIHKLYITELKLFVYFRVCSKNTLDKVIKC